MNWDLETRRKLAKMVKEKALAIQDEEFMRAKGSGRSFYDVVQDVDRRILEKLAPLGFRRANQDWKHESNTDVMLFKQSRTNLWFETAQARIVKISKKQAEKVMVLGIL